jgi:hypothetical protein
MRNTVFDIKRYEGAGPLRFGMTQAEVVTAVGEPTLTRKTRGGDVEMRYPDYAVRLAAADQTVAEIGFSPRANVAMEMIDVFGDPCAFQKLVKLDGEPLESLGIIVLLNLGLALTGFHDGDEDQKWISAFRRGRWDDAKDDLKRVKFQA